MNIKDIIQLLAQSGEEFYCKVCIVDSVDEKARTVDCTPIDEGAQILAVNLQANQENNTGIIAFPKVGSFVVIGFLNQAAAVVLLYDEIEKIEIAIGNTSLKINKDGVVINGGGYGGLVKIEKLTDKINAFIDAFNNHTHQVNTTGSATAQSGMTTSLSSAAQKLSKTDYENDKVKHG